MGRGERGPAALVLAALVVALALACPRAVLGAEDPPDPGETTTGNYQDGGTTYSYIRYVPRSLRAGQRVPLVVMIHGAQTTALQEVHATGFDRLAEREGFVVLYPDTDEVGSNAPSAINHSWKFYDASTYFRGNGDAAAIAGMTQETMAALPIDPERVYAVGTSVGGLMSGVEAAAYSDLFAATGNVESAAYGDGFCFTSGTGMPVETSAELAFTQVQPRARVVPTMVMTSDADLAFPQSCGEKALQQGLRTNNLVLGGSQTAPLALTPASVRQAQVPGGYSYEVGSYRDAGGCLVAEQWLIHGMPHTWPGGPTVDPRYTGYTDRKAPSGADATWAFVSRYRRSDTGPPCTETTAAVASPAGAATVPPAPAACVSRRRFTVHLPRARKLRATLDGARVPVAGGARPTVLVDLRGRPGGTSVLRVRGRRADGRRLRVTRRYQRCVLPS